MPDTCTEQSLLLIATLKLLNNVWLVSDYFRWGRGGKGRGGEGRGEGRGGEGRGGERGGEGRGGEGREGEGSEEEWRGGEETASSL